MHNVRNFRGSSLPFKFRKVTGDFDFSLCQTLTSLDGCPEEVGGLFACSGNQLLSLKDAPKKVGLRFACYDNPGNFTEEDVRAICKVKAGRYR